MIRRMIAFVTRRDGSVGHRAVRRLRSPRASVYLEYAIVLPLAVLMISTLIEFCSLWDAKIMANHAAWTCARIATVEAGQGQYADEAPVNRLRTKGMKTATMLLMSTCSMGSLHGSSTEFSKHWFQEMIVAPLKKMQTAFESKLTTQLTKVIGKAIEKILGKDAATKFVKEVAKWIADAFFSPLITKAVEALTKIFGPMLEGIGGVLDGNRQLRQLAYAAGRMVEYPESIVTVTEHNSYPLVFAKVSSAWGQDSRLDFPRCLDSSSQSDDWFVTTASPWPPNNQRQRMIEVKIAWPFERAWMFPVLSVQKLPDEEAKSLEGAPTAVGRALFFPQPLISNDNLKSEGATPFAPGKEPKIPEIIKKILERLMNFLNIAALYYHYQLDNEYVGPYDSSSSGSWTYKGIGKSVTDGPTRPRIYEVGGLVKWMERVPDDPSHEDNWKRKSPPADYLACWNAIQHPEHQNNEHPLFWRGIAFHAGKRHALRALSYRKEYDYCYGHKEWFSWGIEKDLPKQKRQKDENQPLKHLRQKHKSPHEHKGVLKTEPARRGFLVGTDELPSPVSQQAYEEQLRTEGGAAAPYALYAMLRDAAPDVFGSRARTMVATWRPDLLATCAGEEAAAAVRFAALTNCQAVYDDTRKLIQDCSTELDRAVGGGPGEGPGDPGGFFDVGGLDEEIMKDPKKAAEIIEKKLQEMRDKVFPALREVNDCEQRLRDLDAKMPKKANELAAVRQADLRRFAVATGRAILDNGLVMNPAQVRAKLLANHAWADDGPLSVTRQLKDLSDEYYTALVNLYNAELALGKALGCKSAQKNPPIRPDDPKPPFKPTDPDPHYPKPSSPDSGTDEDNAGDSWTHGSEGWTKDGGGSDV